MLIITDIDKEPYRHVGFFDLVKHAVCLLTLMKIIAILV